MIPTPTKYTITPEFERWYYEELYPFIIPFIMVTIVILVFNGFTLYLFYVERKTTTLPEKYIISMTCGDFFVGVSNIVVGLQAFYIPGILDPDICYALNPFGYLRHAVSVLTLMITTIDRYHCTVFPHHYRNFATEKFVNLVIIFSWLIAFVIGFAAYGASVGARGHTWPCSDHIYYVTFLGLIFTPVCLIVIIVLYVLLLRKLNATIFKANSSVWKQIGQLIWSRENTPAHVDAKEIRLNLLLILTCTIALISWAPTIIAFMIFIDSDETNDTGIIMIFLFFPLLHSIIHPLLYALNLNKIRKRAKLIFGNICCVNHDEALGNNFTIRTVSNEVSTPQLSNLDPTAIK